MTYIRMTCPACESSLRVSPRSLERTVTCSQCDTELFFSKDAGALGTGALIPREIRRDCPSCNQTLKVHLDSLGKKVTCSQCSAKLRFHTATATLIPISQQPNSVDDDLNPLPHIVEGIKRLFSRQSNP